MKKHFVDDNHALSSGLVAGALIKAMKQSDGLLAEVIMLTDAEGNYLPKYVVKTAFGHYTLTIEPTVSEADALLALRSRINS